MFWEDIKIVNHTYPIHGQKHNAGSILGYLYSYILSQTWDGWEKSTWKTQ